MTRGWILATRSDEELAPIAAAVAREGLSVIAYPVLSEDEHCEFVHELTRAMGQGSLVAFTSRRAPGALHRGAGPQWEAVVRLPAAAVGAATALAAEREGFKVGLVGDAGGEALASLLVSRQPRGSGVIHPCGCEHREEFARALEAGGVRHIPVVVYRLAETAVGDLPPLPPGDPLAVLLTSPRAARAYLTASRRRYASVPHLALGATTAAAAAEAGVAARQLPALTNEAVVEELCRTCS